MDRFHVSGLAAVASRRTVLGRPVLGTRPYILMLTLEIQHSGKHPTTNGSRSRNSSVSFLDRYGMKIGSAPGIRHNDRSA